MNVRANRNFKCDGSILVVTIVIVTFLGIILGAYLYLIKGENVSVAHSQHWNTALVITEAGVDEAFAQLNWGSSPGKGDLSANGWGTSGGGIYGPVTGRKLSGGSYDVSFTGPLTPPTKNYATATIYATGTVSAPLSGQFISRKLQVTAELVPLFVDAIDVKSNLTAHGSSYMTVSWNSMDPTLSTNGQFWPGHTGTNGNVAAENGTVNLTQHRIDGNLYLGPNVTFNPSQSNQVTGTIYGNYNLDLPDAQLPNTNWFTAAPTNYTVLTTNKHGSISGSTNTTYDFTTSGAYIVNSSAPIVIEPGVTVVLDIKATSFDPSEITVLGGMNNSGTVMMYQESGTATLGGGAIAGGYRPENFQYYGLPGVTQVTLNASTYIGLIYAPDANLTVDGAVSMIQGSLVSRDLTLNGNTEIAYDQAALLYGPSKGFVPIFWREL